MYYYTITTEMTNELGLKSNNLLVYAIIKAHQAGYYGSRSNLANLTGSTLRTVDKSVKYLVDRGLISTKKETVNKQIKITYWANETNNNNLDTLFKYIINNLTKAAQELFCKDLLLDPPNNLILRFDAKPNNELLEHNKQYFERQVQYWNLQHKTNYKLKYDYLRG